MHASEDSFVERVNASFKQLSEAASTLNAISDSLGKLVAELSSALKDLNLGVSAWVDIVSDGDDHSYWSKDVGFAKVDGKWGIALRVVSGLSNDPDSEREETKPFNEAPRDFRLAAIDKLPDLIDKLRDEAEAMTTRVSDGLTRVQQVVAAVSSTSQRSDW